MSQTTVAGSFITLNTIDSDHYIDGSIDLAHIGANQIDGTKLALASQAAGDIMYYNGTDWIRVGVGTDGQVLTVNNAENAPGWEAASAGATLSGSTNNTIVTVTGSNAMIGEANLTFDGTNLTVGTGNVVIGTHGKGIDFSANTQDETGAGSISSEILDDYEEGSWVPEIWDSGNDDGGNTTYHTQGGQYTKIGNRVFVQCHMHIQTMGSITGGARIGGLPFTSHSTADRVHGMSVGYANALSITAGTSVSAVINPNLTYMTLHNYNLSAGAGPLYISGIGNDGNFTVSGHYEV